VEETKIELYVPIIIPINKVTEKENKPSPPNSNNEVMVNKVVSEVRSILLKFKIIPLFVISDRF